MDYHFNEIQAFDVNGNQLLGGSDTAMYTTKYEAYRSVTQARKALQSRLKYLPLKNWAKIVVYRANSNTPLVTMYNN